MRTAPFIAFEGIDASGKSTQVAILADRLAATGEAVHVTAEPTTGPIGSLIRQSFAGRVDLDDRVIASLFVADRLDHLTNPQDGILGLLGRGISVITDRYYMSSFAYHGSDVPVEWIGAANSVSTDLLRPDLTIYIDLRPEDAAKRLLVRREGADRFEELPRLESAYRNYQVALRAAARSERVVAIDGNASPASVADEIWLAVEAANLFSAVVR